MASSLHSRLMVSYGLLITVLVFLFSAGSIFTLLRNPQVYENASLELRRAQQQIDPQTQRLDQLSADETALALQDIDQKFNVRAVLVQNETSLLSDSRSDTSTPLRLRSLRLTWLKQHNEIGMVRDESLHVWLVLVQPVSEQKDLILAARRPRLALLEFFTNEFLRPVTTSAITGFILSFVLAFGMARWIARPIQKIDSATNAVAEGHFEQIDIEGPGEVKQLAVSFNRMAARVSAAQQSQQDLVANVSHELKTPLTSIQGFSQAILDEVLQTPAEIQQAAQVIYSESNRMQRLVQDLIALARLEGGSDSLNRLPVDLKELTQSIVDKFYFQAQKANIQLACHVQEGVFVQGDADRLAEVFSNLVDNALRYTPQDGSIQITSQLAEHAVQVRVSDTGPGIASTEKDQIFKRFYQGERGLEEQHSGSGLGLAIARQIIINHGGKIWVENNLPHGAVFIVEFPR